MGEICLPFLLKADFGVSARLTICTYDISPDGGSLRRRVLRKKRTQLREKDRY
jgi:hypothetical protein